MTATERLRQLLNERGVEWIDFDGEPTWMGSDRMHYARQELSCDEPTGEVTVYHLTPEQAIEATLGRGTCEYVSWVADNIAGIVFRCSKCGNVEWPRPRNYCPNCGRRVEL